MEDDDDASPREVGAAAAEVLEVVVMSFVIGRPSPAVMPAAASHPSVPTSLDRALTTPSAAADSFPLA